MTKYTWTKNPKHDYPDYEATREDGTYMQVFESLDSAEGDVLYDVFVRTASGCCEFLEGELEVSSDREVEDLFLKAEDVSLPYDATGSDGCGDVDDEHVIRI